MILNEIKWRNYYKCSLFNKTGQGIFLSDTMIRSEIKWRNYYKCVLFNTETGQSIFFSDTMIRSKIKWRNYYKCAFRVRPNKKKYLVSVTLSQIFRGGRAGFFLNFYSFFNFLIVFLGGMGAVFPPYRWYFLCWCCEGRHFAIRTLYTQDHALLSISI